MDLQIFYVIFGILGLIGLYFIIVYNSLSSLVVRVNEAWSQIDVQLKRRVDLIPNLVESVKGYAEHEKELFENVTKARSNLMNASSVDEISKADTQLMGALKSVFAIAEAYPELKAQDGFLNLQKELSDTEDKVSYSRQFYNSVVLEFNQKLVVFPTNFIGKSLMGFSPKEFFEADEKEREAVKVNFN